MAIGLESSLAGVRHLPASGRLRAWRAACAALVGLALLCVLPSRSPASPVLGPDEAKSSDLEGLTPPVGVLLDPVALLELPAPSFDPLVPFLEPGQQESGPELTLRQALRSIATEAAAEPSAGGSGGARAGDDEFHPFALTEFLLESRTAGAMLNAVVQVKAIDGRFQVFSLFGRGDFVLEVTRDVHLANVYELSTETSVPLRSGDPSDTGAAASTGGGDDVSNARESPVITVDLATLAWQWFVDFESSPNGTFVTFLVGVALAIWGGVKVFVAVQRRSLGNRRRTLAQK